MSSSKEFRDFVLEQLNGSKNVSFRPMMGEFLLYYNGTLFGGIYDDRLLVKMTESNKKYNLPQEIPYENAKPMYVIESIDDADYLCKLIEITCKELIKKR